MATHATVHQGYLVVPAIVKLAVPVVMLILSLCAIRLFSFLSVANDSPPRLHLVPTIVVCTRLVGCGFLQQPSIPFGSASSGVCSMHNRGEATVTLLSSGDKGTARIVCGVHHPQLSLASPRLLLLFSWCVQCHFLCPTEEILGPVSQPSSTSFFILKGVIVVKFLCLFLCTCLICTFKILT